MYYLVYFQLDLLKFVIIRLNSAKECNFLHPYC